MRQESKVPLFDRSVSAFVEATFIDGITWDEIQATQDDWAPEMKALLDKLEAAKYPKEKWPEHSHWNWRLKALQAIVEDQRLFGLHRENRMQGLMMLKPEAKSKLEPKAKQVYIEYVTSAPWNLDIEGVQRGRYKQVGRIMLASAVQLSREQGFRGRVGLYALPQTVTWYQDRGMVEVQSAQIKRLRYFELTPEASQAFLPEN